VKQGMLKNYAWFRLVPLVPVEKHSEGIRLHMKIHTHSPTFLPVLSISPIDYYDGGTVRMNTEFYSWDTSLGTHAGKLYSASTLVLFEVLLAVGMGAHRRLKLNVP
jgi:hypothetical protein